MLPSARLWLTTLQLENREYLLAKVLKMSKYILKACVLLQHCLMFTLRVSCTTTEEQISNLSHV